MPNSDSENSIDERYSSTSSIPKMQQRARSVSPVNRNGGHTPVMNRLLMPPKLVSDIRHNVTFDRGSNYKNEKDSSSDEHLAPALSQSGKLMILQKESKQLTRSKSITREPEIGERYKKEDLIKNIDTQISQSNKPSTITLPPKKTETYNKQDYEKQRKIISEKIEDIQKMLTIELKNIDKKSEDPKKDRRRDKIEKLFKEAKNFSEMDYDMDTWREIEDYWEELRAEQYERLKDNVALTDDVIIDNDFLIVDSIDTSNNSNVNMNDDEMLSISLDIVAIYLKGQKILYTEAKTFCEQQLNFLMLPAIFISALSTVLSLALDKTGFGSILISSLTAVNSFLLAIISYLKLDAKSEAHKTSAYQFDKLQSKCEFGSGRVIFFSKAKYLTDIKDDKEKENNKIEQYKAVFNLIDEIELKVTEIKDMNKFILPERVRRALANLYGVNVFSAVKSFLTSEKYLKAELNRCIDIQKKYSEEIQKVGVSTEERAKYRDLIYTWNVNMRMKRDIERKLIEERENYMKLDRSMLNDISSKHVNQMDCCCCNCCGWLKT